jgi:excisionase family DNA binding protein
MDKPERILLRPAEVADALGMSKSTIYALLAKGDIPSVRIGGMLRVPTVALTRLIAEQVEAAGAVAR